MNKKAKWIAAGFVAALLVLVSSIFFAPKHGAANVAHMAVPASAAPVETTPVAKPLAPCPVKLVHPRMTQESEMEVSATIVNVSGSDITAVAFGATHTDAFGTQYEPYKTALSVEKLIKKGQSRTASWTVLMEEPTRFKSAPGSSEMWVHKVAFADGRVLDSTEIADCNFKF